MDKDQTLHRINVYSDWILHARFPNLNRSSMEYRLNQIQGLIKYEVEELLKHIYRKWKTPCDEIR